jgi:hypothetical protein
MILDIIWNFFAVIGILTTIGIAVGIGIMWENIR